MKPPVEDCHYTAVMTYQYFCIRFERSENKTELGIPMTKRLMGLVVVVVVIVILIVNIKWGWAFQVPCIGIGDFANNNSGWAFQ